MTHVASLYKQILASRRMGAGARKRNMSTRKLARLIGTLGKLPRDKRKVVAAELAAMESHASSVDVIRNEMPVQPDCPRYASRQIIKHGRYGGLQRFQFCHCNRTLNAPTGTPLAHPHLHGKWLGLADALRDGLTLHQATLRLQVTDTAFRRRSCFLALPQAIHALVLIGIAEADEAYFLRSGKSQHRGKQPSTDCTVSKCQCRSAGRATPPTLCWSRLTVQEICATPRSILAADMVLCADGCTALAATARQLDVERYPINVPAGGRVSGARDVQNVNAFGSRLHI
jgi:transposase-like protein